MADINNEKVIRFIDGGTLTIAGDTVLNIVNGSGRWSPGGRPPIVDYEGAAMKADIREGDDQPSRLALDVKVTAGVDLHDLFSANGTDGYKPKYALVLTAPAFRGATSGIRLTLADAVVERYEVAFGQEYDTLSVTFMIPDHDAKFATYAP